MKGELIMIHYLIKRIGQAILIMLIVSILTYLLVDLMPGDPIFILRGMNITEEVYMNTYYELNLDKPAIVRYVLWLKDILQGDFGMSYAYNMPVFGLLTDKLMVTAYLSLIALLLSFPIGIFMGIITAVKRGKWQDTIITLSSNLLIGIPQFAVALVCVYVFSMKLRILPSHGFSWPWETSFSKHVLQCIMPVFCLTIPGIAGVCRQTRSSMLEVMRQDYVRTARSKGLKEGFIIWKHVMNNGLLPIITLIGDRLAGLIGGSLFVESVFAIPGMGTLMVNAINSKDMPVIQSTVLLTSLLICVSYIITDILYIVVDPRVTLD